MATVSFTEHLRDHAPDEPLSASGETVGVVLTAALAGRDRLRSYVLDEHGRLRRHVAIFVDGRLIADRVGMSDTVGADSEVFVAQALSGG